jgi:hypothetical protein
MPLLPLLLLLLPLLLLSGRVPNAADDPRSSPGNPDAC